MTDAPAFSIIVPVYDSQQYLEECLSSIQRQSFADYEVVLVDDGSSDASVDICRRFAQADPRFKLTCQENAGTSAARNTGLALATGRYVTFIDNDDLWTDEHALERMHEVAERTDADLILHESVIFDDNSGRLDEPCQGAGLSERIERLDKADAVRFLAVDGLVASAVWTKACKRDLIQAQGLTFPAGRRSEDIYWTSRALMRCERIAWCDAVFYAYRKNHAYAQTSHSLKLSHLEDLAWIIDAVLAEAADDAVSEQDREALHAYLAYPYVVLLGQSGFVPRNLYEGSSIQGCIERNAWLMRCSDNPSVRLARTLARVLGIRGARPILCVGLRRRYPNLTFEAS